MTRILDRLVNLQHRVEELLLFFQEVGASVEQLLRMPLLEYTKFHAELSEDEDQKFLTTILDTAAIVKINFLVTNKITQTYMEISKGYIMPGLNKFDFLGITTENQSERKLKLQELGDYERNATREVHEILDKVRFIHETNVYRS